MSWCVNERTTTDEYPTQDALEENGAAGIKTGIGRRFIISVSNKPIYRQLLTSESGEASQAKWQPERRVLEGTETNAARGLFGIRCRSAEPGKAAVVDIEVFGPKE